MSPYGIESCLPCHSFKLWLLLSAIFIARDRRVFFFLFALRAFGNFCLSLLFLLGGILAPHLLVVYPFLFSDGNISSSATKRKKAFDKFLERPFFVRITTFYPVPIIRFSPLV